MSEKSRKETMEIVSMILSLILQLVNKYKEN